MRENARQAIYNKKATEQSKNIIFIWLVIGLIYILISPSIKLFSWVTVLFILPGIFIASLLSMPLFLLKNKIALNMIKSDQGNEAKYIPIINFLDIILAIIWPIVYLIIISKLI